MATDLQRLREVIKRVNKCPLGCGALAGNPFDVDREAIAKELGFSGTLQMLSLIFSLLIRIGLLHNSLAAVGDRDFVVEALQWSSTLMLHLSRWAEDMIIYSSAEFGFVKMGTFRKDWFCETQG